MLIASGRITAIQPRCHRADPRGEDAPHQPWWLVYCRVHQELRIADRLHKADVPHFLPLLHHDRTSPSGRKWSSDLPMFPGYLFLTGEGLASVDDSRVLRGIVSVNPIADVPGLVADLSRLCDLIDSGAALVGSRPIQQGDRVRITSGLWEGYEGVYVREKGVDLVLIEVRAMGRAVEMAVPDWQIERIDA